MMRKRVSSGRTCSTSSIQREVIHAQGQRGSTQMSAMVVSERTGVVLMAVARPFGVAGAQARLGGVRPGAGDRERAAAARLAGMPEGPRSRARPAESA